MADFMSFEDIRTYVQGQLAIRVPLDELKKANPETAQKIYIAFLRAFKFNMDNLNQIPFEAVLSNPDYYQDLIPYSVIFMTMNKLLTSIGSDLTLYLDDVLNPRPKKLRLLLGQLCQFHSFWETKMRLFAPIQEEFVKERRSEEVLEKANEELRSKINKMQQLIQETSESLSEKSEVSQKLAELTKKKSKYSADKERMKNVSQELCSRLRSVTEEREILPSLIEKMKEDCKPPLSEVQSNIQDLEKKVSEWEGKCDELRKRKDDLVDNTKVSESCSKVQDLIKLDKKVEEMLVKLLQSGDNIKVVEKGISSCKNDIMVTEKAIQQKEEMLNIMKMQNGKTLWRRQCELEERNQVLQNLITESTAEGNKQAKEILLLTERLSHSQQAVMQQEEAYQNIHNDYISSNNLLKQRLKVYQETQTQKLEALLESFGQFNE